MSVLQRDLDAYESALDLYQQAARSYNRKADAYDASVMKYNGLPVVTTLGLYSVPGTSAQSAVFQTVNPDGTLGGLFANGAFLDAPRTAIEGGGGYYLVRNPNAKINGKLPDAPGPFKEVLPTGPNASFAQVRRMNQISLAEQERGGGLLQEAMSAGIY